MNKELQHKYIISVFSLPHEIEDLENLCLQFSEAFNFLIKPEDWLIDISIGISKELVDWTNSEIGIEYFENRVKSILDKTKNTNINIEFSEEIKGCVDKRRESYNKHSNAVSIIWADPDIIFKPLTLAWMENAIIHTQDKYPYSIITPELVRVWDKSWDCLVNSKFLDKPVRYNKTNDPYEDSYISSNVLLEVVDNSSMGYGTFKFGGGLLTCISGKLLRKVGIPESFSSYGLEDTFVMLGTEVLKKLQIIEPYQFKLKGVVVCENIKYRKDFELQSKLATINKTAELRKINNSLFNNELSKLYNLYKK